MDYLKKSFSVAVSNPRYDEILWTPCVEWAGYRTRCGYGQLRFQGRLGYAHRVAWIRANGPIPAGMQVCHRCDNPSCVRLDHLFLGTAQENAQDMARKGRTGHGTLSPTEVQEIRELCASGLSQSVVGDAYGVDQTQVSHIARGTEWSWM
jgi:hypothetical protein